MRRGKRRKGLVKLMASVSFLFRYRVGVILLKFARRRGRQVAPSALGSAPFTPTDFGTGRQGRVQVLSPQQAGRPDRAFSPPRAPVQPQKELPRRLRRESRTYVSYIGGSGEHLDVARGRARQGREPRNREQAEFGTRSPCYNQGRWIAQSTSQASRFARGDTLMPVQNYEKVWHNGEFIAWDDAKVHAASHVISYASCLFEGIRCYETPLGPAIFRLKEHTERLIHSCKIYRTELDYTKEQLEQAMIELIRVNKASHCYIRPVVFRGFGEMGVNPLNNPVEVFLMAWEWGKYLGTDALNKGVDACVSSWHRLAPNTLPAMAKSAANYMNAQLIKMEAITNGYVEGIALDTSGNVSEGSGANIFVVRQGKLFTTPLASSVLPGITRDSVIALAQEMGCTVIEQSLPREILYIADELFFCGTAAEVTPIRSVDRIIIGNGKPGPITRQLQERYLSIAEGRAEDRYGWLSFCNQAVAVDR